LALAKVESFIPGWIRPFFKNARIKRMEHFLKHKLLGVPAFVWGLQLLYVAAALGLLAFLSSKLGSRITRLPFQIAYVIVMVILDIIWRTALKKAKPDWF
jgi:hypothetical protein